MKAIAIVLGLSALWLFLYIIDKRDQIVLNPGDPTEVILCKNIDKLKLKGVVNDHGAVMTHTGDKIYLQEGVDESIFLHGFCHLVDRCLGDENIAKNRLKHLPIKWTHQIEELISEKQSNECIWETLQRRYKCDVIQHEVIKKRLSKK